MSGYREHSFDPYAGERPTGPPMRPFNWVQWTGVVLAIAGIVINLVYLGGEAGWLPKWFKTPIFAVSLPIWGVVLINSRRQPVADPAPELAAARRKWTLIVTIVCGVILGIATIFALKGD